MLRTTWVCLKIAKLEAPILRHQIGEGCVRSTLASISVFCSLFPNFILRHFSKLLDWFLTCFFVVKWCWTCLQWQLKHIFVQNLEKMRKSFFDIFFEKKSKIHNSAIFYASRLIFDSFRCDRMVLNTPRMTIETYFHSKFKNFENLFFHYFFRKI